RPGRALPGLCVPTIVGELRRHFRDASWAVNVPRGLKELTAELERAQTAYAVRHGRPPSPDQLVRITGRPLEEVLEGLQARSSASARSCACASRRT
ncbi:MAG TPA: hypothetical protein VK279_15250, partial [Solirubrobacteraceae bacterium]|nr:hypothetical protein [Solirubrobacteraceae bacterium]